MANVAIKLTDDDRRELEVELYDEMFVARGSMQSAVDAITDYREYLQPTSPRYDLPFEGACELVPPFVKESLYALQAEISPALINPQPYLRFGYKGCPPEVQQLLQMFGIDPDMSRMWEGFMQALYFEEMRARLTLDSWNYAGLRDGTTILFPHWNTVLKSLPAWETRTTMMVDPITGATMPQSVRRRKTTMLKTTYDFPEISIVPIENFTIFPAIDANIQYSELVGVRYNITGHDLAEGLQQGDYDEESVRKVNQYAGDDPDAVSAEDTLHDIDYQGTGNRFTREPLTIFEGVKRLPGKAIDEPGGDYWITYHEKSQTLLRAVPLEEVFWHGKRPFIANRPYANIQGIFGDSVASSGAGFIQDAKMTLFRLAVDATSLGVAPPMLVANSIYRKVEEELGEGRRPFGCIPFPDQALANGKMMQPFAPGIDPRSIIAITEMLDIEGQKGTAATDTLKSIPTPNAITATQAGQIFESSKKLVGHLIEHCAAAHDEAGQQVYELVKQHSDRESVKELWQRVNSEGGIPFELAAMGDYYVTANGISETSNRQILAQRAMEQLTIVRSDETAWSNPEFRWNSLRDTLTQLNVQNIEERIGSLQQYVELDAQNKAMMMQSAMMGAVGGGKGGPPQLQGPE